VARIAPPHPRAFTLIETVLAVSIIATIATLAAMVFASAASHAEAFAEEDQASRAARITDLAKVQWSNRRVIRGAVTRADEDEGLIAFAHDGVSFVTTHPVIFKDWPLVHVTYRVVQEDDDTFSLLYLETRVIDTTGQDPVVGGLAADGRARTGGLVLLERIPELRIERFGPAPLFLFDDDWKRESGLDFVIEDAADDDLNPQPASDTRIRLDNEEVVSIALAVQRALFGDPFVPELLRPRWRPFLSTDYITESRPPAVRIIANWEGGQLACIFAARASRSSQ
jgi:prepilin-type N-terminal cleavage/methylation domain-containing protein